MPQGRHTHGLLASGRDTLEQLFPGFSDDLVAHGAIPVDVLADARWFFEGGPLARPATEMKGLMSTRPLLEASVRVRVRALPNVTVRMGCQAMNVVADERGARVTGVRLQNGTSIDADLVVDATGRATGHTGQLTASSSAGQSDPSPRPQRASR